MLRKALPLVLLLAACSSSHHHATSPSPTTGASSPPVNVVAENDRPGTTAWRLSAHQVATDAQLAAYADHASVLPGESLRLYVSSAASSVTVKAFRIGWYGGRGARLVWTSRFAAHRQTATAVDPSTRMISAPWSPTTTISTTGWPEGLYLLKLTGIEGKGRYVPLVVRSASTTGRVVIVSASVTYEAYNTWGGRSLYGEGLQAHDFAQRSYAVSMDRPFDGSGIRKLGQYELGPVMLAESTGVPLAYLSSVDLTRPGVLEGARGIVSLGHDEYWTVGMRQAVEAARDHGANLAFLGANTAFWRVRLTSSLLGPDRVVVGYKSSTLDPDTGAADTTAKFRSSPHSDPENTLTGMLYECFPARAPYVVATPDFPLFAGTGVHVGSSIPGLVGAEVDRAYPIAGTPRSLTVLSHSPVHCGPKGATFSDSVYFTSPSGAGTFSTGTMSWAIALAGPQADLGITDATVSFVRTVTRNLLEAMARGPMASSIPATPNLASMHESASTSSGSAGPVG